MPTTTRSSCNRAAAVRSCARIAAIRNAAERALLELEPATDLDLNVPNATDLLVQLGLEPVLYGRIPARWLVSACERRLAMGSVDPEIPTITEGRLILCGRAGATSASAPSSSCGSRNAGTGWVSWG
jgi:hypothetical protein